MRVSSLDGADITTFFGPGTFVPIDGDYDGNGTDTIGGYDASTGFFFLRNSNTPGAADTFFGFGAGGAGVLPLIGDWDGNGTDTVGIYIQATGTFFLRNSNTSGPADITVNWSKYRGPGDVTIAEPKIPLTTKGDEKLVLEAKTTATFSAPGEYWLLATVNDLSGDGGGGDQCCWTSAHVRVMVK